MAGQLDRLVGLIGMSTVELGIVPLGAPMQLTPKHGFMIKDHPKGPVQQTEQTNKRWTSPSHPDGHGLTKAARILAVTHTIICPTY